MTKIKNLHVPLSQLLQFDLTPTDMFVYSVILYHAYKADCRATNTLLSEEVGVSTRTITNSIKTLEEKKCISVRCEKYGTGTIRYIKPLVLFDMVLVPENFREEDLNNDNGGFTEL